ncbi:MULTISPECIES: Stp1/IreP family PP2C-type Ser/Thr phosphatase [Geobacillus]|jgi:PPM family protein phosphatase|uniref:protein-serine/threonine phosphatase n=2 Tax=Geobacillus thermodenitrificans TaxID=33940 RepID=A4IM50_GEOTN|nr:MULTISPECIES: Stp1/IreP family PP2C-type Ser/Thr phosphatase [Geobacillus]ABO66404.1 Protein phosphatase 2C, family protein [Geobacillus thermodenitrificans NG80-2]ARA99691.1 protein phosphatase [Geobacillus thermodenitrificans]ARP42163.1 Serine/threonine phosphatase stp [Geobacillus thermodenitrificans]ATO36494.1 protein phosphatase [Geobacillus thermodenitrificans]KQB93800.1 Protein phosphatase PrpC [Geobacillus sp. PA-3]
MQAVFRTDIGQIREYNEDSGGVFANQSGQYLAVVADGMGGHRAGDVASAMAVAYLQQQWEQERHLSSPTEAEQWLKSHIAVANERLLRHALSHPECQGMGTTVVVAICTSSFVTIAHIGDSRCYLLNQNGIQQLTDDHSLVNELVKSGQISKEDAEHHPRKNVLLRALGTEPAVKIDVKTVSIDEDDMLLLCSDGLSNKVPEADIVHILTSGGTLEEKAEALIDLANERGGEDNISLAVIDFSSEREGG